MHVSQCSTGHELGTKAEVRESKWCTNQDGIVPKAARGSRCPAARGSTYTEALQKSKLTRTPRCTHPGGTGNEGTLPEEHTGRGAHRPSSTGPKGVLLLKAVLLPCVMAARRREKREAQELIVKPAWVGWLQQRRTNDSSGRGSWRSSTSRKDIGTNDMVVVATVGDDDDGGDRGLKGDGGGDGGRESNGGGGLSGGSHGWQR